MAVVGLGWVGFGVGVRLRTALTSSWDIEKGRSWLTDDVFLCDLNDVFFGGGEEF